jgi:hypothetical protein
MIRIDASESEPLKTGGENSDASDDLLIAQYEDSLSKGPADVKPRWATAASLRWAVRPDVKDTCIDGVQQGSIHLAEEIGCKNQSKCEICTDSESQDDAQPTNVCIWHWLASISHEVEAILVGWKRAYRHGSRDDMQRSV